MEPKIIFLIILVAVLIYFRFGAGSRLLKKKSHHYIVPPACENDPNWLPIDFEDYNKQIYIEHRSTEDKSIDLKSVIEENCQIENFEIHSKNNWSIITLENSNFEDFHKLIAICYTFTGEKVLGFCSTLKRPRKDYIVKVDDNTGADYLIGSFRDNQNFGIYLPKSGINLKGNISSSRNSELYFDSEFAYLPLDEN